MASLEIVNATLKDQKSTDKEGHSNTTSAVQTLNNTMKTFITMMNLQNMKMLGLRTNLTRVKSVLLGLREKRLKKLLS